MCFAMFSATRVFCHRTAFPFFILREYKINKMNHNPTHVKKSRFCTGDLPGHDRLVWVDCEMTGLDIETDHLIEIACLVTDGNLNMVAEGPNLIIHQSDEVMNSMNDWCVEHHGKSGLTAAVKESKISLQEAEMQVLSFVRQHTPRGKCPLAGNSVHADKRFLEKYMPQLVNHLHYRIVDVSTIKELCKRWYPNIHTNTPRKLASHRALDDIKESIKELEFYRSDVFRDSDVDGPHVPHNNGTR